MRCTTVESCVEETLRRVGRRITLGTPLGLGKANHLVNEFYRRARDDSRIELRIYTALTLGRPRWRNDLERRFIEPLVQRLFGDYPELEYVDAIRKGELPPNVRVNEFYFQPGSVLETPLAQREHISTNYTYVVRDLMDAGMNVLAQLVGVEADGGAEKYSLSCNPDLTLDLVPLLRERERAGERIALLAQVNRRLPFMYGDAEVEPGYFDAIVDDAAYDFKLFAPPNRPVSTADYMLALHVSTLIRDGGTIQIGIGSLGHAVTYLLQLRHERNDLYRDVVESAGVIPRFSEVVNRLGGVGRFERGLYASSEMLVDGFLELRKSGILKRLVYEHAGIQRLINEGRITDEVSLTTLEALRDSGVVAAQLRAEDFELLQTFGILRPDVRLEPGALVLDDGTKVRADLTDAGALEEIARRCLGDRMRGGCFAHACFFLGPGTFYEALRDMDRAEREQICMTGISHVNALYGSEELKRLQRKDARFVNTGLVATLGGAVSSDGLEDGRVVSGVGGQYNFVAMAHALDHGRSILMIRATDEEDDKVISNIRWSYAHVTIPRHLRDFVVTEYGIADLRGKSDEEIAVALIEVADCRFQERLVEEAKHAAKISPDYTVPEHARQNLPQRLEEVLAPYRARGLFERFPFGTELTDEELVLRKALERLKRTVKGRDLNSLMPSHVGKAIAIPESARPYLRRMQLEDPEGPKEIMMQRAVVFALAAADAI